MGEQITRSFRSLMSPPTDRGVLQTVPPVEGAVLPRQTWSVRRLPGKCPLRALTLALDPHARASSLRDTRSARAGSQGGRPEDRWRRPPRRPEQDSPCAPARRLSPVYRLGDEGVGAIRPITSNSPERNPAAPFLACIRRLGRDRSPGPGRRIPCSRAHSTSRAMRGETHDAGQVPRMAAWR